jgi:hypothetical protein
MKTLLCGLALGLAACVSAPRAWTPPEGAYGDALKTATRQAVLYNGLDLVAMAYATEETPAFQQARNDQLSELFHVAPSDADARVRSMTETVEGVAYIFVLSTNERAWNDLERAASHWALTLDTGAGPVLPKLIHRLDAATPGLKVLYPYTDRFFVPYRVTFPGKLADGPHALVLSGPLGQARLPF